MGILSETKAPVGVQVRTEVRAPVPVSPKTGGSRYQTDEFEVSIVMPCLNEAESIGECVDKAWAAIRKAGVTGEVVVSDNGSTDGSPEIAAKHGARVVFQSLKGYGHAYMKGFEEARGRFILMADSDNTYDFNDLERFIVPLREGADLVMGNRFTGNILPGAMTWSHRYIGNPILSGLLNLFFHTGIGDAHCGMRAFRRAACSRMQLQTGGMEFASEMVINASKAELKITEVPITYYPRTGDSKLESLRDGWRHLRFMLLYSPTHLFVWPGAALMALGIVAMAILALGPIRIGTVTMGYHWMFPCSVVAIAGFQVISLGLVARFYSLTSHIDQHRDRLISWFTEHFRMESGLLVGSAMFGLGTITGLLLLALWLTGQFDSTASVRLSVVALTLSVIGIQTIFTSFLVSMMAIKRRGWVG